MLVPSLMQEKYLDTNCTVCEEGKLKEPDNGQEWHLKCNNCDAIRLVYEPLPHQTAFHNDQSKILGFFGGYGSG